MSDFIYDEAGEKPERLVLYGVPGGFELVFHQRGSEPFCAFFDYEKAAILAHGIIKHLESKLDREDD